MGSRKPNFFDVTVRTGTQHVVTMSIHFPEVLRHELDSAFIESERVSEM